MPAERVKEIQEALQREGYFQGEPTGQYDRATVEAMSNYQRAHNLRTTGYPTAEALQNLGLTHKHTATPPAAPGENKKDAPPQSQAAPQNNIEQSQRAERNH